MSVIQLDTLEEISKSNLEDVAEKLISKYGYNIHKQIFDAALNGRYKAEIKIADFDFTSKTSKYAIMSYMKTLGYRGVIDNGLFRLSWRKEETRKTQGPISVATTERPTLKTMEIEEAPYPVSAEEIREVTEEMLTDSPNQDYESRAIVHINERIIETEMENIAERGITGRAPLNYAKITEFGYSDRLRSRLEDSGYTVLASHIYSSHEDIEPGASFSVAWGETAEFIMNEKERIEREQREREESHQELIEETIRENNMGFWDKVKEVFQKWKEKIVS